MSELSEILTRHFTSDGAPTSVPGLSIHGSEGPSGPARCAYRALVCGIAKGRKRVFLNGQAFDYDPQTYLIASLQLPLTSQFLETPYLAFSLALEPGMLASLLMDLPQPEQIPQGGLAIGVSPLENDLLDVFLRLIRLLDRPNDIRILAPLFQKEILYRLVFGPHGHLLRQLATPNSRFSHVSRAVEAIRERFNQPLRVEALARLAQMSVPTFYRHFKLATTMSPHQFQKQIRLQEARRLLLAKETDAAGAGYRVGYESPSHFSRDYRRFFGVPPLFDLKQPRKRFVEPVRTAFAKHPFGAGTPHEN